MQHGTVMIELTQDIKKTTDAMRAEMREMRKELAARRIVK